MKYTDQRFLALFSLDIKWYRDNLLTEWSMFTYLDMQKTSTYFFFLDTTRDTHRDVKASILPNVES